MLTSLFILIPSVNDVYWLLSVMTAQLAVLFYIFLFLSAWRLRFKVTDRKYAYRIPGGHWGIGSVTVVGLIGCFLTFILGFFPPHGIKVHNLLKFDLILLSGLLLFCLPAVISRRWDLLPKKMSIMSNSNDKQDAYD